MTDKFRFATDIMLILFGFFLAIILFQIGHVRDALSTIFFTGIFKMFDTSHHQDEKRNGIPVAPLGSFMALVAFEVIVMANYVGIREILGGPTAVISFFFLQILVLTNLALRMYRRFVPALA
jgi:hypothetical protein